MRRVTLFLLPLPFAIVIACASSSEEGHLPLNEDGGVAQLPDSGTSSDAGDAGEDVDAEALRCSGDFCLVDLPNPGTYGFTKWLFAGVQVDPVIGAWAIANGVQGIDGSTSQMLRFDGEAWKPMVAPVLGTGADKRNVRLTSLAADGAGHLLAVGAAIDDGTGAIVQGDGTAFTTTSFDVPLAAAWFAKPGMAWAAGPAGAIYQWTTDTGWTSESTEGFADNFVSVWGSGPDDIYVGGTKEDDWPVYGYLGHRTVEDGGATWTFGTFPDLQTRPSDEHMIRAGIALAGGTRFWAAPDVLARGTGGAGDQVWEADPFVPRVAINAFWARAKDDIWAVGNVGRVYHFDGTTWKDSLLVFNGAPLVANLTGIAGTSTGELLIVGDGVALRRKAP